MPPLPCCRSITWTRWPRLDHREVGGQDGDPAGLVADMRAHLHALDAVREELAEWFAVGEPVRGPYLFRWNLPPGLRETEEGLIAGDRLPATGARFVATRTRSARA